MATRPPGLKLSRDRGGPHPDAGKPPLDLSEATLALMADICARVPALGHVDVGRVLVGLSQARTGNTHGDYARIAALRFPDGSRFLERRGVRYALPCMPPPDGDALYIIYLIFPRFLDLPFDRKLLTLVHELYHISPRCDGTFRKVGRGTHGHSRQAFNDALEPLVAAYLAAAPPATLLAWLRPDARTLVRTHAVSGMVYPLPRAERV